MPSERFCASITGSGFTTNPTSSRAVGTDTSGHLSKGRRGLAETRGWLMRASYLFTSESVSEGHPDKVSDQISDAILDAFIEKDVKLGIADDSLVNTRLGCETLCTTNKIVIAGEGRGQLFRDIHGVSVVDRELITQIARDVVKDIGYDQNGISYHGADIEVLLHGQSADIAMGVDAKKKKSGEEEGAGDQGMMFGY